MDIRNVQTFLRVYDSESFTKAATSLNYAQSTVSAHIQQLEQELGFPLFERIGKKIFLTSPGEEFLPLAKDIVNIQQRAYAINHSPNEMHGVLRIGTLESLLHCTLVHVLPVFERLYPHVDVQVKMGNRVDLISWLNQNHLDIVYQTGDENSEPDLHCCYKRTEYIVFAAGVNHPLARRQNVTLQEVLSYSLVHTERTGLCYKKLKTLAAIQNLTLSHSIVVDSTKAICEILQSGAYIAFLPKYSIDEDIQLGKIVSIPVEVDDQVYYSQILYHYDKWIPPFMSELIELIRDYRPEY